MDNNNKKIIPYGQQDITPGDIEAVVDVLKSDFITQGPVGELFEQSVAEYVGAKYAISSNSGTSSLHIACLALGLKSGDYLWTVPNTFVASANCGLYCGARVDFVDIDDLTWNINIDALSAKLYKAQKEECLPKIIVTVAFAGQPCDQEAIWELAQEYDIKIIEDAAHAIGSVHKGEKMGSCRWSDITIFSFHPVKIITTAEGGMCLTNDINLLKQMQLLRTHGVTRDRDQFIESNAPAWCYEQQILGFNYRMSDLHAALGLSQLTRVDDYVKRRNYLADRYHQQLDTLPIQLPGVRESNLSAYHLYVVLIDTEQTKKSRLQVFEKMRQKGIGVNVHYMPVYLQPYYRNLGFSEGHCQNAERFSNSAITIPLFPKMIEAQQDQVIGALQEIL